MTTRNRVALIGLVASLREKQLVPFPLVVPFTMIMRAELGQCARQRTLTEQDQLRQALVRGGANPALRESVQIRASRWKLNRFHTACSQDRSKGCAELGVAIMEHIAAPIERPPACPA